MCPFFSLLFVCKWMMVEIIMIFLLSGGLWKNLLCCLLLFQVAAPFFRCSLHYSALSHFLVFPFLPFLDRDFSTVIEAKHATKREKKEGSWTSSSVLQAHTKRDDKVKWAMNRCFTPLSDVNLAENLIVEMTAFSFAPTIILYSSPPTSFYFGIFLCVIQLLISRNTRSWAPHDDYTTTKLINFHSLSLFF